MISYMKEAIERLREWKRQRTADEAQAREAEAKAKAKQKAASDARIAAKQAKIAGVEPATVEEPAPAPAPAPAPEKTPAKAKAKPKAKAKSPVKKAPAKGKK